MKTLIVLFLSCLPCLASFTNVVGLEVETNGWVLRATIGGDATGSIGTNGNFFSGFATNNTLTSTTALTLTLTSMGFDDSGNGIQVTRKVYGTKQLRAVYPMQNTNDIQFQDSGGTNVVFRIALSDYIYSSDSNITASALGGWISGTNGNSTNVAAISSQSVTNSSTQSYQATIANWSMVPWQRFTNNTARLTALAFHNSAQAGRPVRCVQFIVRDQHSNAKTNIVLVPSSTIEPVTGCAVVEYISDVDISGMTNGDSLRLDFAAYPWVGDSGATLATTDNAYSMPTPYYVGLTGVCDRLKSYGVSYAVVDPTNGTANGVVTTNFNVASPPATFDTLDHATIAIKNTNNILFSRSNAAAAVVYVTNGYFKWTGGSGTYGNNLNPTWTTIQPFPGVDRSNVWLIGQTGNKQWTGKTHLYNLSIGDTNASGTIDHEDYVWVDNCYIESASGIPFYRSTNYYFTACVVSNLANSFTPGINQGSYVLIRGNLISLQGSTATYVYTVIGNKRTITNRFSGSYYATEIGGQTVPPARGSILAYNALFGLQSGSSIVAQFYNQTNQTFGMAIIQNCFEWVNAPTAQAILWIGADGATATTVNNILLWNNTTSGQRWNVAYNETGSTPLTRKFFNVVNNLTDDSNCKSDSFTASGGGNGARIGNWPFLFGVSFYGNLGGRVAGIGGGFDNQSFAGLYGLSSLQTDGASLATNFCQYTTLGAATNGSTSIGPANGNYRLLSSSPMLTNVLTKWVLPFDLEGNARGLSDPPGAYSSANPRKGAFF